MRAQILSIATFLLTCAPAFAQIPGFKGNIGGTIGMSVPKGEFANSWGRNMFTYGGQLAFPHGLLPLQFGFAFDYGVMGQHTSTVPVSSPELTATEGQLAVKAKVLSYHPLLRFSPLKGKFQPYVDGMVGLRQFTALSTVTVNGLDQPISRERDANAFAFSTGWAAGLMVRFAGIAYIEGRVERFSSGKVSYVDPSSITISNAGAVGYNTLNSRTDAVNILVGVGLRF
ncbi:MAG: hypothetical protein ABI373_03795 [Flavobacteriales bacterium]